MLNWLKPNFKTAIAKHLTGDMQANAYEIAEWLKSVGLRPQRDGKNSAMWKIFHNGKCLCWIELKPDFKFFFWYCDYSGEHDVDFIKAVHDRVNHCTTCHGGPCSGGDAVIFGKEFINACQEHTLQITNPSSDELKYVKHMIMYWKEHGHTSVSYHYLHG